MEFNVTTDANEKLHREKRRQEREQLLKQYRDYIDSNNPPLLSDLKAHMEPLIDWHYATLPELLTIVNAKIAPMKVINAHKSYHKGFFDGLQLIDTREHSAETLASKVELAPSDKLRPPENTHVSTTQTTPSPRSTPKRPWWENPIFLTALGTIGTIVAAYVIFRLGWS